MPNLPTVTVTDAQSAKCVSAFTDAAGYKAWLKQAVRDEVQRRAARRLGDGGYIATNNASAYVGFSADL